MSTDEPTPYRHGLEGVRALMRLNLLPGNEMAIIGAQLSVSDLREMTDEQLLAVPGIGPRRLAEIRAAIDQLKLF